MNGIIFLLAVTSAQPAAVLSDSTDVKEEELEEVVVVANNAEQRVSSFQLGAEQMQVKELTSRPALFGEADVMRSLQLLPGVKSESDASSNFQVRGGTAAQNSILLDEAPVYNVGHLAGLFSAFNDNALAGATLYKGLAPAQYGGATSAVFDITSRAGRGDRWGGSAALGLLSAKASVEGPLVRDRLNVLFNVRRSYADLFLKMSDDYRDNELYFYDANLKLNWTIDDRNSLSLSGFVSKDRTEISDLVAVSWRNMTGSLQWIWRPGSSTSAQTTFFTSSYDMDNSIRLMDSDQAYQGHIRHLGLQHNIRYEAGGHEFNAGAQTMLSDVKSGEWHIMDSHEWERRKGWDNSVWASWDYTTPERLFTISAGIRLNAFSALGGPLYYDIDADGNITWLHRRKEYRPVKTYVSAEPRASVIWHPAGQLSFKAGYSRTTQNIHALRNQDTSTPFDRYTISTNLIRPQRADQVGAGLFWISESQDYDVSAEGYYRHVDHVADYRDGVNFASAIEIERLILTGEGRGYGMELCLRRNTGQLTGSVSYTLSWSQTRIDGINGGRWYDANNDRRHDVNIALTYRLNPAWSFSATWVFNSGQAFTAPSAKYQLIDNWIYYYAERNGYRAPDYHRMDIGAVWSRKIAGGRMTREWHFGIYNLYNRYNPWLIRFEDSSYGRGTKATQYSLFGIVPSVTFNLKW